MWYVLKVDWYTQDVVFSVPTVEVLSLGNDLKVVATQLPPRVPGISSSSFSIIRMQYAH